MTIRRLGVCSIAALLLLALLGVPAGAVEDEDTDPYGELPTIDDIGTQSETARQFFPEPAEEQPFTEALVFPLMILAFGALLVIGMLYLKWQPDFEREREEKRR